MPLINMRGRVVIILRLVYGPTYVLASLYIILETKKIINSTLLIDAVFTEIGCRPVCRKFGRIIIVRYIAIIMKLQRGIIIRCEES